MHLLRFLPMTLLNMVVKIYEMKPLQERRALLEKLVEEAHQPAF